MAELFTPDAVRRAAADTLVDDTPPPLATHLRQVSTTRLPHLSLMADSVTGGRFCPCSAPPHYHCDTTITPLCATTRHDVLPFSCAFKLRRRRAFSPLRRAMFPVAAPLRTRIDAAWPYCGRATRLRLYIDVVVTGIATRLHPSSASALSHAHCAPLTGVALIYLSLSTPPPHHHRCHRHPAPPPRTEPACMPRPLPGFACPALFVGRAVYWCWTDGRAGPHGGRTHAHTPRGAALLPGLPDVGH